MDQLLPVCALTGNQTRYLDVCPDWELNLQPFGVWDDAPNNWATLSGHNSRTFKQVQGPLRIGHYMIALVKCS